MIEVYRGLTVTFIKRSNDKSKSDNDDDDTNDECLMQSLSTSVIAERQSQFKTKPAPLPHNALLRQEPSGQTSNEVISDARDDEWTAVLDKQTGGTYWWKKSTGERSQILGA